MYLVKEWSVMMGSGGICGGGGHVSECGDGGGNEVNRSSIPFVPHEHAHRLVHIFGPHGT
jgi:hypothetical protein